MMKTRYEVQKRYRDMLDAKAEYEEMADEEIPMVEKGKLEMLEWFLGEEEEE